MERTQIAPGVHVTLLPGEKFKRCNIAIHLIVPGRRQNATEMAVLPHLLDRNCEKFPKSAELASHLFSLYGADLRAESAAVGPNRVISVMVSGLKSGYALRGEDLQAEYLDLVCQALFRPKLSGGVFTAEDVAVETAKQADYLRSEMNEKREYCLRQARRKLYGDSPLGVESSGYIEDIPGVTPQSLFAAYTELLQTATIEIIACGMQQTPVAQTLLPFLEKVQRRPAQPMPLQAFEGSGKFEYYTEPMETVQGKLCMLFTSGHIEDARGMAVMRVANAALGGLATSRLFTNVREKQSLCYYCASIYGAYAGILSMDSGIEHADCERAAAAMLHELEVLQKELITPEELENAQKALTGAFTGVNDNPDALSGWVLGEFLRGTNQKIEEFTALINSVTREEVRGALAAFKPAVQYAITQKGGV